MAGRPSNKPPEEEKAHAIFLETFVETLDFEKACTTAGVSKSKAEELLKRYRNEYKAVFEKLGFGETDVLEGLIALARDANRTIVTKLGVEEVADNQARFNALKLIAEIMGIMKTTQITITAEGSASLEETNKWKRMKELPEYKQLRDKMITTTDPESN